MANNDLSVPATMRERYDEISDTIKVFCREKLNEEYEEYCLKLCAALSRKRPSPLVRGKAETWACGIIHAIGTVNFLFDKTQTPSIKQSELYVFFGISQATGAKKSKEIRDLMKMYQLDPKWTLPSKMGDNILAWMISVNGIAMDARHAPREIQEEAFRQGLIPYVPGKEKSQNNLIEFPAETSRNKNQATKRDINKAQELIYQAWEADRSDEAIALAKEALKIWPDCSDAYYILADEADNIYEAKRLYEEAVKAAEKTIEEEKFKEYTGHFWGFHETRPYMRARFQLADILWMLGEKEEAVEHFKDMLVLNPNDNQGVRHILVNWLLEIEDYDYFEELIQDYSDDIFVGMKYNNALYLYKTGKLEEASKLLKEAMNANIFVVDYILGNKKFPEIMPGFMGIGDENEAIFYASEAYELWNKNAGAITWLKKEARLFKSNIRK